MRCLAFVVLAGLLVFWRPSAAQEAPVELPRPVLGETAVRAGYDSARLADSLWSEVDVSFRGSPDRTLGTVLPSDARPASGAGGVALRLGLPIAIGAGVGVIYGAAGHPGLPHFGDDTPPVMEGVIYGAGAGALAGIILVAAEAP